MASLPRTHRRLRRRVINFYPGCVEEVEIEVEVKSPPPKPLFFTTEDKACPNCREFRVCGVDNGATMGCMAFSMGERREGIQMQSNPHFPRTWQERREDRIIPNHPMPWMNYLDRVNEAQEAI